MLLRLLLALCLLAGPAQATADSAGQRLVAYFPFWASYSHGAVLSDAPAEKLTHLVYTYAELKADGTLAPGDFFTDLVKIQPGGDGTLHRGNYALIPELKARNPRLAVLISVGGWNWTGPLSNVAADAALRRRFVQDAVAFMDRHGFDGIEIDWRYPVAGGHPNTARRPDDLVHFAQLLTGLRQACRLRTRGCQIAITLGPHMRRVAPGDYRPLAAQADFVSLIATDFHGAWSKRTGHKAPLYAPRGQPSVAQATEDALALGIPRAKLVVMLPAQGAGWLGVPPVDQGLGQPHRGAPWGTWDNEKTGPSGVFTLGEVRRMRDSGQFKLHWDVQAQASMLYRASDGQFVSFESQRSLAAKLAFIDRERLGGVALWEVSSDDVGNASLISQTFRHYHPWRSAWLDLQRRILDAGPWLSGSASLVLLASLTGWWLVRRRQRRIRKGELLARDEVVEVLAALPGDLSLAAHMATRLRTRHAARLAPPQHAQLQRIAADSLTLCQQLQPLTDSVAARRLPHSGDELAQLQRFAAQLAGERSVECMLDTLLRFLEEDDRVSQAERLEGGQDLLPGTSDDDVLTLSADRREAVVRHTALADHHVALHFHEPLSDTEEIYFRSLANQLVLVRRQLQTLARQPQLLAELYEVASRRDKLLFIRADRGYSGIHASDLAAPVHVTLRLRALQLYFDEQLLLQVHRSYLVRPAAVTTGRRARNGGVELLVGSHAIPVARSYLPGLKQRFPQWFTAAGL
ncbi:glycosyl hydrolase family 18 protein [Chitiniphilus purpureus]|uniref:chitinase n=1 Tax=Chitiniphilus purpureus TaxID=2981137 RepID=A0ABY6DPQ8_9NEIS|nr:glycosyl hydrolase family 18 protein [Chitiniphilus sp. CD1]UXY16336.1 glycosyl hydrolase family 18 protein [Chitiniphilus sp. CD1]